MIYLDYLKYKFFNFFNFFTKKNFTIINEFEFGGKIIKEYTYNKTTYYTDTWPPQKGKGPVIKNVVRDLDGIDVTKNVLKFGGPMKNYINPLAVCMIKKKLIIKIPHWYRITISYDYVYTPYEGTVTFTDTFGIKRMVHVSSNTHGCPYLSS